MELEQCRGSAVSTISGRARTSCTSHPDRVAADYTTRTPPRVKRPATPCNPAQPQRLR
jgi:hypothetical protein